MKTSIIVSVLILATTCNTSPAQERARPAAASPTSDYESDVSAVLEAVDQALVQARQLLEGSGNVKDKAALETAVKEMERSRVALTEAKKSPDKLPAALAAEEAAFQALLKALPKEYRMSRTRNRSQKGNSSGQPSQQELGQMDLEGEQNRYETERQAGADQTPQQREAAQTEDRLKQLARRQQDLNERLRDLQTALQEAKTDQQREDIQRQLKRLRDEERQMLSDVDELRQQMEQSQDAARQTDARQQLEQTRNDVQRAAQNLEKQSVSEALASGARAEEQLQNLRENIRRQSSSQFSQQMRDLRKQARDLADKENQIAHDLDALNNSAQKQLDDSAQRRSIAERMVGQEAALTNMLAQARTVSEQAENAEPLLSKQLYDVVRRGDQMRTENQLDVGAQLTDRGFLPQASQMERNAGKNIDELRQGIDRAADSVLGSETDALKFAQKELDDLARQVSGEAANATNSTNSAEAAARARNGTNSPAMAGNRTGDRNRGNSGDTNNPALAESAPGAGQRTPGAQNPGRDSQTQNSERNGRRGQANDQGRQSGESQQAANQPGDSQNPGQENQGNQEQNRGQGGRQGQQASNSQRGGNAASPGERAATGNQTNADDKQRLRELAQQLGGQRRGGAVNGPITGTDFIDWTERLRDVEQAVDSQDVRNQLATVRERVGVYRRSFRESGLRPDRDSLMKKVLEPLALARDWVDQELARTQNERSLVPLDRDPVQEKYSDLVRRYYEKLGSAQ